MQISCDKYFSVTQVLRFPMSEVTFPLTEGRRPEYKYRVNNNSRSASKRSALVYKYYPKQKMKIICHPHPYFPEFMAKKRIFVLHVLVLYYIIFIIFIKMYEIITDRGLRYLRPGFWLFTFGCHGCKNICTSYHDSMLLFGWCYSMLSSRNLCLLNIFVLMSFLQS